MALIPYEPFRLFDPLWNEMDRYMRRGKKRQRSICTGSMWRKQRTKWLLRLKFPELKARMT
jgi:hypothetical protein